MNARLMAAHTQVDMAMGQMESAGDLFSAVVGLQDSIKEAMEIVAVQAVISRKYTELRSYMTLGQNCFREGYFIWPFKGRGRGLTLVELATGKRVDFWFSPDIQPLQIFGFDMANFALSPGGRNLTMVGLGLHASKYVRQSKWGFTLPKASVLTFDLSSMKFNEKSDLQVKEDQRIIEHEISLSRSNDIEVFTAAQLGLGLHPAIAHGLVFAGIRIDLGPIQ